MLLKPNNTERKGQAEETFTTNSVLISKNVRIQGRRTSLRLELEMWDALNEIAMLKGRSVHEVCSSVHENKLGEGTFTSALRIFLLKYYRNASVQNGGLE